MPSPLTSPAPLTEKPAKSTGGLCTRNPLLPSKLESDRVEEKLPVPNTTNVSPERER